LAALTDKPTLPIVEDVQPKVQWRSQLRHVRGLSLCGLAARWAVRLGAKVYEAEDFLCQMSISFRSPIRSPSAAGADGMVLTSSTITPKKQLCNAFVRLQS
jgi:hypothetical protein